MDMSTTESLGEAASILASIASSIAENSAEQQSVSTESRDVVNDVNRQTQIERLVDSVGSVQQQIQTHDQQSQLAFFFGKHFYRSDQPKTADGRPPVGLTGTGPRAVGTVPHGT